MAEQQKKKTTKATRSKRPPKAPTRKIQALIVYQRAESALAAFGEGREARVPPKRIKNLYRAVAPGIPLKRWVNQLTPAVKVGLGVDEWLKNKLAYITHKPGNIVKRRRA